MGASRGGLLLTVMIGCLLPIGSLYAGTWISLVKGLPGGSAKNPEVSIVSEADGPGRSGRIEVTYKVFSVLRNQVRKEGVVYDTLHLPGCAPLAAKGQPAVPVKTLFLELPENPDVTITPRVLEKICLKDFFILPAQPPLTDSSPDRETPLLRDEQVYGRDEFFPADLVLKSRTVTLRDKRLLEIRFTPVQFNPVRKMVDFATHIELLIETRADSAP
jgi:Propeptide_C25